MSRTKEVIILLIAVAAITGAVWWSGQKYEKVSFCGREYEAPVIVIDGVNIIKRIAEVASAEKGQETCKQIRLVDQDYLGVEFTRRSEVSSLLLNGYLFDIDSKHNIIMRPGSHGIEDWSKL